MRDDILDVGQAALFWRQVAGLLRAGLTLENALLAAGRDADDRLVRSRAEALRTAVAEGEPLSDALERVAPEADPSTIATLRAGERSGDLTRAAALAADHLERVHRLALRGRVAAAYPAVVLGFTVVVVSGLVLAMWRLFRALDSGSAYAPAPVLLAIAAALAAGILAAAIGLAVATIAWRQPRRFPRTRTRLERLALRVPIWRSYYRPLVLARFARTLALTLRAGVPFPEALLFAGRASGNIAVRDAAERAAASVADGGLASAALEAGPVFPEIVVWALRLAEERGDLVETSDALAQLLEDTADAGSATFVAVVEPAAIALVGAVGAFALLATWFPLQRMMLTLVP